MWQAGTWAPACSPCAFPLETVVVVEPEHPEVSWALSFSRALAILLESFQRLSESLPCCHLRCCHPDVVFVISHLFSTEDRHWLWTQSTFQNRSQGLSSRPGSSIVLDSPTAGLLLTLPATPASCGSLSTFGPVLLPGPLSPGSSLARVLTFCQACGYKSPSLAATPPILWTTAVCPPALPRAPGRPCSSTVGTAPWPWRQVHGALEASPAASLCQSWLPW